MREVTKKIAVGIDLANANSEEGETKLIELVALEFESIDEFVQETGGPERALIVVNRNKVRAAFQGAVNKYNYQAGKIPAGDENAYAELIESLPKISYKYAFDVSDGLSAKDLKENAISVRDKFMKMSIEEKQAKSAEEILKELGLI